MLPGRMVLELLKGDHSGKVNIMKLANVSKILVVTALSGMGLTGCESFSMSPQKFSTPEEHYQQVLEEQKAGVELSEAGKKLPDMTVEEHVKLGDAHLQQGRLSMAIVQYLQALEKDSTHIATRYKLAMMLLKNGKPDASRKQFQKILEQDDQFALAHEGLGQAYLVSGDYVGADQAFRKALSLDQKLWRSHNYLGIMADRRHLHLSAIAAYKTALAIQPREGMVLNNLGMAYYMNRHYHQAAKTFYQAMQAGSDSPKIANNLGLALAKLGRFPQAFDAFKKSTNQAKAYNNVGIALLEAGQPRRAMSCFEKAIDLQPMFYEKANENLTMLARDVINIPKSMIPMTRKSKTGRIRANSIVASPFSLFNRNMVFSSVGFDKFSN